MKITKSYLKKIIKEEIEKIGEAIGVFPAGSGGAPPENFDNPEGDDKRNPYILTTRRNKDGEIIYVWSNGDITAGPPEGVSDGPEDLPF